VILFVPCQIGFVSCIGNREQASPANGIERTIPILPVRKNNWKCENHRAASFRGESPTYKRFVQKDVQLSTF
jgi:hypothetical protein